MSRRGAHGFIGASGASPSMLDFFKRSGKIWRLMGVRTDSEAEGRGIRTSTPSRRPRSGVQARRTWRRRDARLAMQKASRKRNRAT